MKTPAAEPVPDWAKAKPRLGRMWDVHCIGLGSALALLAMSSVVSLLLSCKKKRFGRKPYVIAINALLLVLGATRAVYIYVFGSLRVTLKAANLASSTFIQHFVSLFNICL